MYKNLITTFFVILTTALLSISITTTYANASETVKGAKKDIEAFKTEMNAKLDKVEKELMLLKAKAKNKGTDVEQKAAAELENTKTQIKKELSELKDDGSQGWKKIKSGLAESFDKLNSKVQKALRD